MSSEPANPAPFQLEPYVEVGNEHWFDKSGSYDQRFAQFKHGHQGAVSAAPRDLDRRFEQPRALRVHGGQSRTCSTSTITGTVDVFLNMARGLYEKYDRRGPEIFVGEWAPTKTRSSRGTLARARTRATPNLRAAIGDPRFMTRWRRTHDIGGHEHATRRCSSTFNPGARAMADRSLIGYDALRVYGFAELLRDSPCSARIRGGRAF